jgi:hypothetical protein
MSLMAIILWALFPLSPWRRYYESARHLLHKLITGLKDPQWIEWLEANLDDPQGIPYFERVIDDLNAGIDLLIYIRAREILGLKPGCWRRPKPSPPRRRRSRSINDLLASLRACALRFNDMERLAQLRAPKLARLLSANPTAFLPRAGEAPRALNAEQANSGGGPAYLLAAPFEATAPPVPYMIAPAETSAPVSLSRSGEKAGARCASARDFILNLCLTPTHLRAGLRVRAPP